SEYYKFLVQANLLDQRLRPFKALSNQKNPQGILELFSRIVEDLGLLESIVNVPDSETYTGPGPVRTMIKRDIKAYSILCDLVFVSAKELLIADQLFQIGVGRELLFNYYTIFRHRLNNAYLLDERNPNVIRVSQWLETRGRSFDYIFAGGLNADRFPLREELNFILPESPRKIFRRLDTVDQSRHLFSHLLRNYRNSLYLSYPLYREEREVQPSQVLMDLESMVDTGISSELEPETLKSLFKWEDSPYLSSEYEMLNAAKKKDSPPDRMEEDLFPLKHVIPAKRLSVEDIIRGVKALGSRRALDGLFEYDGLVSSAIGFDEFLKNKKEIFSASQLETLANCPMRYLFERVYGLGPVEELGVEASPRDLGQHLHAVLRLIFKRFRNSGKNISDTGLDRAFSQAMEVAHEYFMDEPFLKRFEFIDYQKKEFLAGLDQDMTDPMEKPNVREGIFARLLRFEEKAFRGRVPEGIEYQFGYKGSPPAMLGNTGLRGYIDRFDLGKGDKERAYIYDYKSGMLPLSNMIKKGLSFQLPVYVRALKSGLQAKRISSSFYILKKDIFSKESPLKQTISDFTGTGNIDGLDISGVSLIDDYSDSLMKILEKGLFHHSADGIECNYCEFRYACHRDIRRIDHLLDSGTEHHIYSGRKNLEKWRRVDQFRKDWKNVLNSMQKAFDLKTESGRRRHFEAVMRFRGEVMDNHESLPFYNEYVDELLGEIEKFVKRYMALSSPLGN
ncbi:PD-(D/E)XK nuclease family protein, partial [Thermodesulfobacteriota bacterium]